MKDIFSNCLFGITLSFITYLIGYGLHKFFKASILNPLLISITLTIGILKVFNIPLQSYNSGGNVISMFLAPATTVIGYSIYKQKALLKKYFIPIIIGCLVGAITSICSVIILCKLFGINHSLTISLVPKSVTTPIAMDISSSLGGIQSVTVAAVVITGILGSILTPIFIKVFKIKNKIAAGVAIGSCSHAVGTSKALELGEVEGAMSGLSIGISGLITILLAILFL